MRVHAKRIGVVLIGLLLVLVWPVSHRSLEAQSSSYVWRNVKIVAGGFITGIIASEQTPNLFYTRTDIGGLYRWNEATQKWIPLTDWVGWDNWGYNGVTSVAIDPTNNNVVYAAVGTYTNTWDPKNGAILKSTDQGATWSVTPLPFKNGGNMPGRGNGERLAVDPNNGNIVYYGAAGNATEVFGLWKSANAGASFSKVTSFTAQGDYSDKTVAEDPFDYESHKQGIWWVVFDPRTVVNGVTQNIYVGVATRNGPTIHRSTDGGATWSAVTGQPTQDCGGNKIMPTKAVLDHVNGMLYVTYGHTAGPYEDPIGEVFKYDTATGVWTIISPTPNACVAVGADGQDPYYGYNGLAVSRSNPNIIMVTGHSSWWPDTIIWRSTNGGVSWSKIWNWTNYPNRSYEYAHNASGGIAQVLEAPWLVWAPTQKCPSGGRPGPDPQPKVGWMTAALMIDPFNPDRFMYGTGAMLYGTRDATLWDDSNPDTKFNIRVMADGIEEVNANKVISPPSGAPLVTALWDIRGFVHNDVNVAPSTMHDMIGKPTDMDFAQNDPTKWVSVEKPDPDNCVTAVGFSSNSANDWVKSSSDPSGVTDGGTVAYNASGTIVVWSPVGPATSYRSTNPGGATVSWSAISTLPSGLLVKSDRMNANKFYAYDGSTGTFYVSTNGGASFTASAATGLPQWGTFEVSYGAEGDIWLGSEDSASPGLWRSTNSGASFTKLTSVDGIGSLGFGKAASGQTVPTVFIRGTVGGINGYHRSTDAGATWTRINDDQHQWAFSGVDLTGDPRIFGRVYITTNGRGVIYGDEGAISGSPPAAPSNLTATAASSSQINLAWTDNSFDETAFIIERATNSTFSQNLSTTTVGAGVTSHQATGLAASTTYYFRVKAGNGFGESAYSNTASAATQGSGLGTTSHVHSIVASTIGSGPNQRGQALVTVRDNLGNLVPNATVTGDFTGSFNEAGKSAVTDANGVATIQTAGTNRGNISFTFCVTNITHASLTYDSAANVVTCDSN